MADKIFDYLEGKKLYGDDFSQAEINEWYIDELEGYADLGAKDRGSYDYEYHELNKFHAFSLIKNRNFKKALGIGSAYGDEFMPIANNIEHITIIDPSEVFSSVKKIANTPCEYIKPQQSGSLLFQSDQFDLVTSFGALHHIPNVSHVLSECYRCLKQDGVMLIREPISSMGDWRGPRNGLTKRERGIPSDIFDEIVVGVGFKIERRALCDFAPLSKLLNIIGISVSKSKYLIKVDAKLSSIFSMNLTYHRTSFWEKVAPGSIFYVLSK